MLGLKLNHVIKRGHSNHNLFHASILFQFNEMTAGCLPVTYKAIKCLMASATNTLHRAMEN